MYRVKTKQRNGAIFEGERMICEIFGGEALFSSAKDADLLRKQGYEVEDLNPKPARKKAATKAGD